MNPHTTSMSLFDAVSTSKMGKSVHYMVLKFIGRVVSSKKHSPFSKKLKVKRLEWAVAYLKTNFSNVIFTDECCATLDGPDGWGAGLGSEPSPSRLTPPT